MATQVRRDPFTRADLMRERCHKGAGCVWCGQPARWFYYWESDSIYRHRGHPYGHTLRPFCSVGCYRSYSS